MRSLPPMVEVRDPIERALRWLAIVFFASLPFHRPPLTTALGPGLTLPEVVFVPFALVLVALVVQRRVTVPALGIRLVLVLVAGLLPSVVFASNTFRAGAQLAVLLYIASILTAAIMVRALGLGTVAARAFTAGASVACLVGVLAFVADVVGVPQEWGPGWALGRYPWMAFARPVGPTESPTMLALVALSALAGVKTARVSRPWSISLAALFAVTIVLSQSRVLLIALAGLALFFAHGDRPIRRTTGQAAYVLLAAMVVVSILIRVVPLRSVPPFLDTTISPYRVCHEIALHAFRERPLTGIGLENFHDAWPRHYDPSRHDAAFAGGGEVFIGTPLDPHGTIQGYLAEGGIVGIAGLLWGLREIIRARRRDAAEAIAYLGALALALLFVDLLTERSTAAMLGLLGVSEAKEAKGRARENRARPSSREKEK